jgi:hypothetical protein
MATVDDRRHVDDVDAARPTVLQAHHAVRAARLKHCRHGRARLVHRSRRAWRPRVSQYRPAGIADASAVPAIEVTDVRRTRSPGRTAAIATVPLSLLFIGFIRVFDPDLNNKGLVIGVYLIAVTAAVCLNAFTLDMVAPQAGVQNGSAARLLPRKPAGEARDSRPNN